MGATFRTAAAALAAAALIAPTAAAAHSRPSAEAMIDPADGWRATPVFTIGETVDGYQPPGIPDGLSTTIDRRRSVMTTYISHELSASQGYAYTLANGTSLTGARISALKVSTRSLRVLDADLAYDTIYDVDGVPVTDADQINPLVSGEAGIGRLCSARGVVRGEYGFVDTIHFTGEEQNDGVLFALDAARGDLWAMPAAGLLAWENVSPVDTGNKRTVALLGGDDREGAPLWLYVGTKSGTGFLERNGLTDGTLYAWVADANAPAGTFDSPAEFGGNGSAASGTWAPIDVRDADGSLRSTAELDAAAKAAGAFAFSRPEDLHENPRDGQQLVLASTGRTTWDGASDVYGTTYLVDVSFRRGQPKAAELTVLYDGDQAYGAVGIDAMLRSPDNLTWASDGKIYVQEDRATDADWGTVEASVWQLDPKRPGKATRIATVDRSAVPAGQVDVGGEVGTWETSGIVDVTSQLRTGSRLTLLLGVQAHSVTGGTIADDGLVQGGQLALLESTARWYGGR